MEVTTQPTAKILSTINGSTLTIQMLVKWILLGLSQKLHMYYSINEGKMLLESVSYTPALNIALQQLTILIYILY